MPTALARRFKLDVSTDNSTWVPIKGINDLNPQENATLQSADDYDSNGFASFEKTLTGVKITIKALRKTNAGAYDPGQETVRATWLQFGAAARVYLRWYDRNGFAQAYSGYFIADYQQAKTGVADLEEVTMTFTADGVVSSITNPGTSNVPVITNATPSGAAAGALVTVTGAYFTGTVPTTGVKIGGVNATNWSVVSDSTIVFTVPAGTAGSAPIVVTNATGASNSFPYTRA